MKMNKFWVGAVVLGTLVASAGQAQASPIGSTGSFNWVRQSGFFTGQGGEFTVYDYTGLSNFDYSAVPATKDIGAFDPSFQTFCLETTEGATNPSHFVVGSAAVAGGAGGGSPDPISKGTAYLYSEFAKGTLGGYFAGTRSTEAGKLQNAIWMLEDEIAGNLANTYYAAAVAFFGSEAAAKAAAGADYLNVYVLVNFGSAAARDSFVNTGVASNKAQDFLYYRVPDGGVALALLGGALLGIGALRRKLA